MARAVITGTVAGVGGGIYGLVLGYVGAAFLGGGHGTDLFWRLSFAPLSLVEFKEDSLLMAFVFLFWPMFAVFATFRPLRILFYSVVGIHYVSLSLLPLADVKRLFATAPNVWLGVYVAGQILLWGVALAPRRRDPWEQLPTPKEGPR